MGWQRKPGGEFIDHEQGMHLVTLHHTEIGLEHKLQVHLAHDVCVGCKRITAKDNLDEIDPMAEVDLAIAELNKSHDAQVAYAKKHRIPVRRADGKVSHLR